MSDKKNNQDESIISSQQASPAPKEEDKFEQQPSVPTILTQFEQYSGPLPHPKILAGYDQIVPGAAEKIIDTFVEQAHHRMYLEKTVIEGDSRRANWGVAAATIITLLFLAASYNLIINGHELAGSILGISNLAILAGVFIYGTNSRKNERLEKTKMLEEKESNNKTE